MNRSQSSVLLVRQRPGDRVRNYILGQDRDAGSESGGRLPTMRDIAAHLSVSLATVQSVYRALKREGRIITRAGDGTYLAPAPVSRPVGHKPRLFLNLVPRSHEEKGTPLNSYYGAIVQALAHSETRFDLAWLDADSPPETQAQALFERGELDAMLIFPFIPCQPLIDTCDTLGIPYVTIHPSNPSITANFVTPDFLAAGYQLGRALQSSGRRRVAIFSYGSLYLSSTGWAILAGLSNGCVEDEREVSFELVHFNSVVTNRAKLRKWLLERRDTLPDVVICHNPSLNSHLRALFGELKVSIPDQVSIIFGLDTDKHDSALLGSTRLAVDFERIGETAINLLTQRMKEGGKPLPGIKHPIHFIGGATTTEVENQKLRINRL